MLQTFTFKSPGRQVNAQGTYFRYEAGSAGGADETIRVRADGQDLGTYLPGDSIRLPQPASWWEISTLHQDCAGTIRLGMGEVESARLVGTVRVIDESVEKTRSGNQFFGLSRAAPIANKVGLTGIEAGGKWVAIKRMTITSPTAGKCLIFKGTGPATDGLTYGDLYNKDLTAPPASARRFIAQAASTTPTPTEVPGVGVLAIYYVPANEPEEIPLTTPILLPPGHVLGVGGWAVNTEISVYVDAEELN